MGFSKKCLFWNPVFWPFTSNKCMGLQKVANWLQFYRRSFDVDSKSVKIFEFGPPGTSECRFYWFWPSLIEFKSQFLPDDKNIFKTRSTRTFFVQNFLLNFSQSWFGYIRYHLKNFRPGHRRGHGHRFEDTANSLIRWTREYILTLSITYWPSITTKILNTTMSYQF